MAMPADVTRCSRVPSFFGACVAARHLLDVGWKIVKKVNTRDLDEIEWSSPGGKFGGAGKEISEALGREPHSTDLLKRHPFDVEILRMNS
jgi:hypothetical protein